MRSVCDTYVKVVQLSVLPRTSFKSAIYKKLLLVRKYSLTSAMIRIVFPELSV